MISRTNQISPEEYLESFKAKYNLSYALLAHHLGKEDRTVRGYLFQSKNKKPIPPSVMNQIRTLDQLWQKDPDSRFILY
jgi:hypothetical protein